MSAPDTQGLAAAPRRLATTHKMTTTTRRPRISPFPEGRHRPHIVLLRCKLIEKFEKYAPHPTYEIRSYCALFTLPPRADADAHPRARPA